MSNIGTKTHFQEKVKLVLEKVALFLNVQQISTKNHELKFISMLLSILTK